VGDLVSYFAIARDNAPGAATALSDIYFLQVRPFRRDFREAPSQGGGGQGGQGGMDDDLSAMQRQIIAASGIATISNYVQHIIATPFPRTRGRND